MLITVTSGDPGVPVNTGIALALAARLVEMSQTDPSYGIPIDQVLVRAGVVEGVPGTHRFDDPAGGVYAALPGHVRCDPPATCMGDVLIDPTGYSCDSSGGNCSDGLDAPRLTPPLRQQLVDEHLGLRLERAGLRRRGGAVDAGNVGADDPLSESHGPARLLQSAAEQALRHGSVHGERRRPLLRVPRDRAALRELPEGPRIVPVDPAAAPMTSSGPNDEGRSAPTVVVTLRPSGEA